MFSYKTLYSDLYKGHSLIPFAVVIKQMLCLSQREVVSLGRKGHWYIEAAMLLGWSLLVWEPVSASRRNVWLLHPSRKNSVSEKPVFYEIMVCCSLRGSGRVANHLGLPELSQFYHWSSYILENTLVPGKLIELVTLSVLTGSICLLLCRNDKMVIKNCGTF